jgi:beta-lactamase superfamily II metal-dependent hydrolase
VAQAMVVFASLSLSQAIVVQINLKIVASWINQKKKEQLIFKKKAHRPWETHADCQQLMTWHVYSHECCCLVLRWMGW